jgi:hypothetical protein
MVLLAWSEPERHGRAGRAAPGPAAVAGCGRAAHDTRRALRWRQPPGASELEHLTNGRRGRGAIGTIVPSSLRPPKPTEARRCISDMRFCSTLGRLPVPAPRRGSALICRSATSAMRASVMSTSPWALTGLSMPVATTETRIVPSSASSKVAPTMMLASGVDFLADAGGGLVDFDRASCRARR